jgi:lipopolysaccharide transport system permease protein
MELGECWYFREVLVALALRDVKLRYKQTLLGAAWVVMQPLLAALVFAFLFGRIANLPSEGVPYALFAFTGLIGWNLFASTLVQASNSLVANEALVSKVFFPRLLIPFSVVPAALIDLSISALVLVVWMGLEGISPHLGLLWVPLWMVLLTGIALGLGSAASVVAARYRDVQRVMPLLVQFLQLVSPVAYGVAVVRDRVGGLAETVYLANPLAPLLEGMRWSILGTGEPSWPLVAYAAGVAALVLVGGVTVFQAMQRRIADVL